MELAVAKGTVINYMRVRLVFPNINEGTGMDFPSRVEESGE